MLIRNPRTLLTTLLLVLTVGLVVACNSSLQDDAGPAPVEVEDTPAVSVEDPATDEDAVADEEIPDDVDAAGDDDPDAEQPESPVAEPQFSPLNAANTGPWARSIASRRTLALSSPAPGTGNVRGRFVADTPSARVYLAGEIYLAPVIFSEGKISLPFVSLNVGVDPKATARTEDGEFVFESVKPGYYGLVLYTPVSQYLAPDAAGIDVMYIEVEDGQTVELEDILVH